MIAAKLDLTLKLFQDTPHAPELLDAGTRLSGDLGEQFVTAIRELLTSTIERAHTADALDLTSTDAAEIADIILALTYGLEHDLSDPQRARRYLRLAIKLLLAGLSRRAM